MSKSISRNVRHAGLISALVMAPCLAINAGVVSAETIKAQLATAPNVPPPITRTQPATVVVNLEATEWVGPLSDDNNYEFWGYNKSVPGPMIRVMLGDTVEIHLKNDKNSKESHNIDFHAITGPGGGASLLNSEPGQESAGRFKMLVPGIFLYHCATASPSIPEHIANGMYGTIIVEPVGGLKPVEKEFYVMQSEFYMEDGKKNDTLVFSNQKVTDADASYIVHNGHMTALVKVPLRSKVGERR